MIARQDRIELVEHDLDRGERDLARITPLFVVIYASVVMAFFELLLLPIMPDLFRIPTRALTATFFVGTLLATYCLNTMSRPWSIILSLFSLLMMVVALGVPAATIVRQYAEAQMNSLSITLDPYQFRSTEVFSLQSPRNVQIALSAIATAILFYTVWRGWITIARLSIHDRNLLKSPHVLYATRRMAWLRYIGMPPVVTFMRHGRLLIIVLFVLASLCMGMGIQEMINQLTLQGYAADWSASFVECRSELLVALRSAPRSGPFLAGVSQDQIIDCVNRVLDDTFYWFYVNVAVVLVLLLGANGLLRLARRRVRLSANELLAADDRPPILFLRSFRDDQVSLPFSPKRTWLGRMLALWQPRQPCDHLLLDEGTPLGPVVALGSPRDRVPPYGVSRGYFENKNWQQAVETLAADAQAIVICLDDTEGIWWEVDHIATALHLKKTLFVFHPCAANPEEHARIAAKLTDELGKREGVLSDWAERLAERLAGGESPGNVLGFFFDRGGALCIATSSTFSDFAYLLALRWFLRYNLQHAVAMQAASAPPA
jgi:hypothetical protein